MDEIWKDVLDARGYQVSNLGRVRSFWTKCTGYHAKNKPFVSNTVQRMIPPKFLPTGYAQVQLYPDGTEKHKYIHRLVLEAFVGPCPQGMEACHNDGDRKNNSVDNLRWDTKRGNMADAVKMGHMHGGGENHCHGENHHFASLSNKQVLKIRQLASGGVRNIDIAKRFNITGALVWKIVSRYSWKRLE